MVNMPNVLGMRLEDAVAECRAQGVEPVSYTHLHTECDAIIMDHAKILAVPQLEADDLDAALIHQAAIGKIAGEQIIMQMTLGLTEQEAEEQIHIIRQLIGESTNLNQLARQRCV